MREPARPLHPLTIGLALGAGAGVWLLVQWLARGAW